MQSLSDLSVDRKVMCITSCKLDDMLPKGLSVCSLKVLDILLMKFQVASSKSLGQTIKMLLCISHCSFGTHWSSFYSSLLCSVFVVNFLLGPLLNINVPSPNSLSYPALQHQRSVYMESSGSLFDAEASHSAVQITWINHWGYWQDKRC